MESGAKKRTGSKSQPQPLDVLLPDGTKVTFPAPHKKPLSPYMAFQMEKRQELLAKEPNLPFTAIGSKLGACWQKLSPAEKEVYTKKYREEYDEYKIKRQAYESEVAEIKRRYGITDAILKGAASPSPSHKSPFQLFRDKMARQFETNKIAVGDFEKIVLNMWEAFSPQEKLLYVSLAKKLYPQNQAPQSHKRPPTSSPRPTWNPTSIPSSVFPMGAPLPHTPPSELTARSPPGGGERYMPPNYSSAATSQRMPSLPTSPFAVYQDEMRRQTKELNIEMANFNQTTKTMWKAFSKEEKAVYIRLYNERLVRAMSHQTHQSQGVQERSRDYDNERRSPSARSASYHGNKRPHSETMSSSSSMDSFIMCPGDHLTEDQKKTLKRVKTPSFNFEVADHLGSTIGQVLEFTWKQEPLNAYLAHQGPNEEAKIPDSFCVYKDKEVSDDEMELETEIPHEMELETELPPECEPETTKKTEKETERETEKEVEKDDETADCITIEADAKDAQNDSNDAPEQLETSENVKSSNPAITNLLNKQVHTYVELSDSDESDIEFEIQVNKDGEDSEEESAKNTDKLESEITKDSINSSELESQVTKETDSSNLESDVTKDSIDSFRLESENTKDSEDYSKLECEVTKDSNNSSVPSDVPSKNAGD